MKALLTSDGITNESLMVTLKGLAVMDQPKVAFVATAAGLEGDQSWVEEIRQGIRGVGGVIIETDISKLSQLQIRDNCESADVIWLNGGNNFYLAYWMRRSGLAGMLPLMLEDKVYVGLSAGSMVAGCSMSLTETFFPGEPKEFFAAVPEVGDEQVEGLGWLDFAILPHYLSENPYFSELRDADEVKKNALQYGYPIWAISDGCGIVVDGNKVEIVGDGAWKKFNQN